LNNNDSESDNNQAYIYRNSQDIDPSQFHFAYAKKNSIVNSVLSFSDVEDSNSSLNTSLILLGIGDKPRTEVQGELINTISNLHTSFNKI